MSQFSSAPSLDLIIGKTDFEYLDSLKSDVLEHQRTSVNHKKYVKALLIIDGEEVNVKIRLKGDRMAHYETNPPSLRIRTIKDKLVLGTNKFSLHAIHIRNGLHEWIYLDLLAERDILSVKMDIVEYSVNGRKTVGAFEEHFTDHLLKRFDRPKGPIIAIEEKFYRQGWIGIDSIVYTDKFEVCRRAPLKVFNEKSLNNSALIEEGIHLLDDFRCGLSAVEDIFDIDKMAYHYAIIDLMGAYHNLSWHNQRFYYNSIEGKLELIGYDGLGWKSVTEFSYDHDRVPPTINKALFSNKDFLARYFHYLHEVSTNHFLDSYFEENLKELEELTRRIYSNDPFYENQFERIYSNAQWIRENLKEYKKRFIK
ncbi:MAG: hypothetical protein HRT72_00505 [Flavobacteriales bacterium]|nr:hypothetical protein [Flavobacteriales bacterium]